MSHKRGKVLCIFAASAGMILASQVLVGCGGEQGGVPSGVGGALTDAQLRISSFGISTGNQLATLDDTSVTQVTRTGEMPPADKTKPDALRGVLYPSQNAKSFRLVVKGAGVDREDVTEYFPVIQSQAEIAANYDLTTWNLPGKVAPKPGRETYPTVDNLYASYERGEVVKLGAVDPNGNVYVPVQRKSATQYNYPGGVDASGNFIFRFERKADDPGKVPLVYTSSLKHALRSGQRTVLVEFYNLAVNELKSIASSSARDSSADAILRSKLTNVYAFDANIRPKEGVVDLTGGFEANNGDNGFVDSSSYPVKATKLPPMWKSVVFEAWEERSPFVDTPVVFRQVVNNSDSSPDLSKLDSAESTLLIANRQRNLRVYATCYSEPDGQGIVLAQTVDTGAVRSGADGTGVYPVQFRPNADATVSQTVLSYLGDLQVAPALSELKLKSSEDTGGFITKGRVQDKVDLTLTLTGTVRTYPRHEPYAAGSIPDPTDAKDVSLPNSLLTFEVVSGPDATDHSDDWRALQKKWLAYHSGDSYTAKLAATEGDLTWGGVGFSHNTYKNPTDKVTTYQGVIAYVKVGFKTGQSTEAARTFGAQVAPNQGSIGGGVIK